MKKTPAIIVNWQKDEILWFKDEPIYLVKDIQELHTTERWYKEQREVIQGSVPVRRVRGLYNDQEREANLYGLW
jgi:hypothetical protein